MNFLTEIIKPPIFEDEEKTHQAYLLNIILWSLIAVPVPYLLYILTSLPEQSTRAWIQSIIAEVINVFLLILMHQGYVRTAGVIQTLAFWGFFTVTAYTGSGVQDEAYMFGYPLVILIVGLLLGTRPAIGATALCLASGLGMIYANTAGLHEASQAGPVSLTWVISLGLFPIFTTLQYLTGRTMRKAIERAQLSEEKYKLISRVSSDYAFESRVNEKGEVETFWIGGAFEKMTGFKPEDYFATGGWYSHIHPEDVWKDAEDIQRLMKNEDVLGSEIRTFAKDGEIRWERVFAHPIWSKEENRLVGIVGAVQDITEQKEAERKLQEYLHQQKAILDNIPNMAWLKDTESRYIAVNEQFLKVSGKNQEEVIGNTDLEIWDKPYAVAYRRDDREVMESGLRKTIEEFQKDGAGREYWVETTKTPIRNDQGQVIGTTGIARDISERKLAELERERLIAELGAKNVELERFTYTVSHDLKSPLVTINGFLGYLEQDAQAGRFDKFTQDLNRILQAVDKMQALLNDLLELSRIGRIINRSADVEFGSIVRDALALLEGPITAKRVRVYFMDDGHKVFGDRIRLMEVLQNLLENAIKFMGDQPNPEIRIGSFKNNHNMPVFYVQDNGIGMEPQFQDRVFGLFNKLDAGTEGTGIGLALVKRIIEVHHGRIWLESQPGKGTTFYFTLSGGKG